MLRNLGDSYLRVEFDCFQYEVRGFLPSFLYSFLPSFLYSIFVFVKNRCEVALSAILRCGQSGLLHQVSHPRNAGADFLDQMHPCEEFEYLRVAGFAHVSEVFCHDGEKAARVGNLQPVIVEFHYDVGGGVTTGLTRRTIVEILKGIRPTTFHQFKLNPEEFIVKATRIINDCKAISLIQHICYQKSCDTFDSDIFAEASLRGTVGKDAIASAKSLYDMVVLDSQGIEKSFAESLEAEDDVVVYSKLPNGFYINTPMGKYNPDWAIAFREGSVKHVYFVAETKGNPIEASQLRGAEDAKIECARRHFAAISTGDVVYSVVKTYQDLYNAVTK